MLHDLKTLFGSSVTATDGEIGTIRNFLFDDQSWKVRYLVVDLGSWLKQREVILAVAAVEHIDWTLKNFHVKLTRKQVRKSPGVDESRPVSRQQQMAMRDYFGCFACWLDREWGTGSVPTGRKYPLRTREDQHLRSVWDLTGYAVWSSDRKMGLLDDFIVDEVSRQISYLIVKNGDWLQSHTALVPTRWVKSISWPNRRIDFELPGSGIEAIAG